MSSSLIIRTYRSVLSPTTDIESLTPYPYPSSSNVLPPHHISRPFIAHTNQIPNQPISGQLHPKCNHLYTDRSEPTNHISLFPHFDDPTTLYCCGGHKVIMLAQKRYRDQTLLRSTPENAMSIYAEVARTNFFLTKCFAQHSDTQYHDKQPDGNDD